MKASDDAQWIVYRVSDLSAIHFFYLEKDARKKCRLRNNEGGGRVMMTINGELVPPPDRFKVANLGGMTHEQWKMWQKLGGAVNA